MFRLRIIVFLIIVINPCFIHAQIIDEEERPSRVAPQAIDFSQIFSQEKPTREEFEAWQRLREERLRRRLTKADALELAVDPVTYIVGPGDQFTFNIALMKFK